MQALENTLNFLDGILGSAFYFPIVLLSVGVFFTVYLGFPQIRFFKHAWSVLRGKHSHSDDPGDTTHFQALATALSGTVGTGNIGGVAFAIFLGGPAALFWMWATAFVGMTTKFVEVSISHKYRRIDDKGQMVGGPMHFMEHGLNLKWLAAFFAVATIISSFGSGNLPQANNMAAGLETSFAIPPAVSGAVFAIVLGLVIVGGIRRIAVVASTLVPLMGTLYAIGAIAVVLTHYENILPSFAAVISDAFTGSAATGGFLGATFAYAFNRGVNRGLFSNEAWLSTRWRLTDVVGWLLLGSAVGMVAYAMAPDQLTLLLILIFVIGVLQQGGFNGLYATAAKVYPTEMRTTGIGWAIGLGRIGAVAGPAAAGYLVAAGFGMSANFLVFAVPVALGGVFAYRLGVR